jgi:hypothetical protein
MPQSTNETQRIKFLLTSLVIIFVFILTLVLLAGAYPLLLAPPPTQTPTITQTPTPSATFTITPAITLTPSITPTPLPTSTPTPSLTPTETSTPTLTPTPTGPPMPTNARPIPGYQGYRLNQWSPEQAQRLIDILEYYPNTLTSQERGEDNAGYYATFAYAALAEQEALLRFPDASQSQEWRWNLAYNSARTGLPQAAGQYAGLIVGALNQGEITVPGLSDWFHAQEPRLSLYVIQLEPPSGFTGSYLIEIRGQGSAFIWLLENQGQYSATVLTNNFDFIHGTRSTSLINDLTGDGIEEVVIYLANQPGDFQLHPPLVFDLAQAPAKPLTFRPSQATADIGMDFRNHWVVSQNPSGPPSLQFKTDVFPPCPVTIERTYQWNGNFFELNQEQYTVKPGSESLNLCHLVVDQAATTWGPQAAIQIMEALLPGWPPAQDEQGNPYPPDARDEWRYRLGIYQALTGNMQAAIRYFTDVANHPTTPESRWIAPATAFLSAYHQPIDLYRACAQAIFCNPSDALQFLIKHLPPEASQDVLGYLVENGMSLRATGTFDFNGDGQTERWFTVRHRPDEKLEFWILAQGQNGVQAIRVDTIESNLPSLTYDSQEQNPPVVWLDNTIAFTFKRDPDTSEAYITRITPQTTYPDHFKEGVEKARQALFVSGKDPRAVKADLLALQVYPGLLCKATFSCDLYYYLLGLSSELAGDKIGAVDAYLRLWSDYSKSPYALMARLRLEGPAILISPTPTSRPGTQTITPIPGITTTPTPTLNITATITPTPTTGPYP